MKNLQFKNTVTAILQHLTAILCGLILPRIILAHYGSTLNGMVHSISSFLSYTVLIEFGIGAVIPAAFYKPLTEGDRDKISAVIASGYKVYRKIAAAAGIYLLILIAIFPCVTKHQVSRETTTMLLIVSGIGTIVHYLLGAPENLLLISDQKGYIAYGLSTASTICSTLLQIVLVRADCSLAFVKLCGTFVGFIRIAIIYAYVHKNYEINTRISYDTEPIPQKWNGIAQHVAYFILEKTDIFLLTLFASLEEISVYSVYFMVVSGVRKIFNSVCYSIQPKLGELQARGESGVLNRFFQKFERSIHLSTAVVYTIMGLLLVPFIRVYTEDIHDAQYIRPLLAGLMAAAYALQSFRDPYDKLILASGHFKQTQNNYIIAACLNFIISLFAVIKWGTEGVVFGTVSAMLYQLIYMAFYDSRNLLKRPVSVFLKMIASDILLAGVIILIVKPLAGPAESIIRAILSFIRL